MPETPGFNEKALHFENQSKGPAEMTSEGPAGERPATLPVIENKSDEMIDNLVSLFRDFLETTPSTTSKPIHSDTPRNVAARKRFFGLAKDLSPETGCNNRYDYEQKYPRDRFGEEAADNARVWLTYLDEAELFDRERVEGWRETVDVLLVFAGLFSGVITTFVSQASQGLQQDNTQVTASLLLETVQILRAQFTGLPISQVPNTTLTPTSPFTPSTNAVLVNGLWFTSLAVTLSTALFAVLAKQWLYYYTTSISGTAKEKVRVRQLRFNGFELWKVGAIVDLLPILLHLAVGMFLTGIIILLFPLEIRLAWTIVVITGITYTLYFISVILPIRYPECPYTTSLTIYVGIPFLVLRESFRWISSTLNQGSWALWGGINLETRRTIHHLVHYTQSLSRHAFMSISKAAGAVRRNFRRIQPTIFTKRFPEFTKWREVNIKAAVKNAAFLDSEALDWLYETSPNSSVHRIIARCVAVDPVTGRQIPRDIGYNLCRTLDASEMNVTDLRYALCLALRTDAYPYWALLQSIPDMAEIQLGGAEYQSYFRIYKNMLAGDSDQALQDAINSDLILPLTMWCYFLSEAPRDATVVHILATAQDGLFEWKFDPNRDTMHNAGLVRFDSEDLGWWKFEYLYNYFKLGFPDYSSELNSFETRYNLLIAIYRNLTSDQSLITDKVQKQKALEDLFENLRFSIPQPCPYISPVKHGIAFFREICCVDAFWSESMTDRARYWAAVCLNSMWGVTVIGFPFNECDDLTLIYHWCLRNDLDSHFSWKIPPMLMLLLIPHNRQHLSTILLNDPNAVSHFSGCFQNLGKYQYIHSAKQYIYPVLMDLLKSVNTKMPLFTIVFNSSVLLELWKILVFCKLDTKMYFDLVTSKLDKQKLDELFVIMNEQAQFNDKTEFPIHCAWEFDGGHTAVFYALQASVCEFGQIIGVSHSQLEPTTDQSAPESSRLVPVDKDYDIEEGAHHDVPGLNEHNSFYSNALHWTKSAFTTMFVWPKKFLSK